VRLAVLGVAVMLLLLGSARAEAMPLDTAPPASDTDAGSAVLTDPTSTTTPTSPRAATSASSWTWDR